MAKNKKPVKIIHRNPTSKKAQMSKVNDILNIMHERMTILAESVDKLAQLVEANRVAVISVNKLMYHADWPVVLTKTHQFMFGLVKFLKTKYPDILDEIHQTIQFMSVDDAEDVMKDLPQQDRIDINELEYFLGRITVKVGYTEQEFRDTFRSLISFKKKPADDTSVRLSTDEEKIIEEGEAETDKEAYRNLEGFFEKIKANNESNQTIEKSGN